MYEVISEFYDLFSDKTPWVDFAENAVKGKGRGADVGCGSGAVTARLALSHELVAVDPSPEMLRVAMKKLSRLGLKVPLINQRAERLALPFKAEFITAMCDVVNYIRSPRKFFEAAYNNLVEGGLLVFDISSEYKLRNIIANNVFTDTRDDVTYVWENRLGRNCVDMTVTFFVPAGNGLYERRTDESRQYIYSMEELREALNGVGFGVKVTDKKDRIYFVAKKGGRRGKNI